MIEEVDRKLQEWVSSVVGDVEVRFDVPRDRPGPAVWIYLLDLQSALPEQRGERRPLQMSLRYLITTWADEEPRAHALLGKLALAALERNDAQVELRGPSPETWSALGVAPRPAFFMQLPLVVARPLAAGRIRRLPDIHIQQARSWSGVVLTSDDVPVADARVELTQTASITHTDERGRFSFGVVPEEPRDKPLKISAKGQELTVTAQRVAGKPLLIRFDPRED